MAVILGVKERPMSPDDGLQWLSVHEAAVRIGYSDQHVRRLAGNGTVEARKVGGDWQIAWPQRYLEERRREHRGARVSDQEHKPYAVVLRGGDFTIRFVDAAFGKGLSISIERLGPEEEDAPGEDNGSAGVSPLDEGQHVAELDPHERSDPNHR